jgi:hypothetical protein
MMEHNVLISDIYYRNFGISKNKILMFDYHDIEKFDASPNFLITNLYSVFTLLGQKIGWNVKNIKISHWNDILEDDFGKGRFPEQIVELLCSLHSRDKDKIGHHLNEVATYLREHTKREFHSLRIDDNDIITINYPPKTYNTIFNLVEKLIITTLLDGSSCVGLKMAQDLPNLNILIACNTPDEVSDTKYIINNCMTYNASVVHCGIMDMRANKYDLVLYHLVILNLLRAKKLPELFNMIRKQVGKYFVIEIPVMGDVVLMRIIKNYDINYEQLTNQHTFRTYLCANNIKVNRCSHIDYTNRHLKRYLYICEV